MKYKKTFVCLIICLQALLPLAYAGTTPKGLSGLINIPSAYVSKSWTTNIGYFNTYEGASLAGNVSLPFGAEFAYSRWRIDHDNNYDLFSFKVPVLHEQVLKPAIAIGVEDITDKFDRNYYIAMSKQGPMGFRLHLGARSGDTNNGVFYGLEKQIRLKGDLANHNLFIPVLNLTLEYDGQHLNYGFYIRHKSGVRVDFAWHDDRFRSGVQFEF